MRTENFYIYTIPGLITNIICFMVVIYVCCITRKLSIAEQSNNGNVVNMISAGEIKQALLLLTVYMGPQDVDKNRRPKIKDPD